MPKSDTDNISPNIQLDYWLRANRRALAIGEALGPERFYLINYDKLCQDFVTEVQKIEAFLEMTMCEGGRAELAAQISTTTMGRYRDAPKKTFTTEEMRAVSDLGFEV